MMFYLWMAVLIGLAILFVLWPAISNRLTAKSTPADEAELRESANIMLYQDHLQELEFSLEQGQIDAVQFEQLKSELARNLLEDSQEEAAKAAAKAGGSRLLLWLTVLLLPIGAAGLYLSLGAYDDWQLDGLLAEKRQLEQQWVDAVQRQQGGEQAIEAAIQTKNRALTEALKAQLDSEPENLQSWALLARTSVELEDFEQAINSYQQILRRDPDSSQIMAEMAQVIFSQSGNQIVPIVSSLTARALKIDPNNNIALGLAGIEAFQKQDYTSAISRWQQALRGLNPNSSSARALQNGIAQAQARLAVAPGSAPSPAKPDAAEPGITIEVNVSLAEGIAYEAEHTVFIYARAWEGPKMPLAIARLRADQLPTTVTLNESMAMMPSMTLANFEQVQLVARLSASGGPVPKPGDWQVLSGPVSTANPDQRHSLVISEPIPQ